MLAIKSSRRRNKAEIHNHGKLFVLASKSSRHTNLLSVSIHCRSWCKIVSTRYPCWWITHWEDLSLPAPNTLYDSSNFSELFQFSLLCKGRPQIPERKKQRDSLHKMAASRLHCHKIGLGSL